MTSVQGRKRLCQEHFSVAPSITLFNFSPTFELSDRLSDQPAELSRTKLPVAVALVTAINDSKYFEDDLQKICKAVLKAQAPVFTSVPTPTQTPVISEIPWEKLKARSSDIYHGKSHMDCYNFCQ